MTQVMSPLQKLNHWLSLVKFYFFLPKKRNQLTCSFRDGASLIVIVVVVVSIGGGRGSDEGTFGGIRDVGFTWRSRRGPAETKQKRVFLKIYKLQNDVGFENYNSFKKFGESNRLFFASYTQFSKTLCRFLSPEY